VWGEEQAQRRGGEGAPAVTPETGGDVPVSVSPPAFAAAAPSASDSPMLASAMGAVPGQADPDLPPGTARLYLNLGRKDGAGTDQIRDLLRDQVGVGQVPSIDVMNTHTYLNVPAEDADRICAALTGKQLGEREMVCERARPRRR
jgi:DbpA-like RNA binding protein